MFYFPCFHLTHLLWSFCEKLCSFCLSHFYAFVFPCSNKQNLFSFICTLLYSLHFDYVSHSNRLLLTVALITACNAEAAAAVSYSMLCVIINYRLHHSGIKQFLIKSRNILQIFVCISKYFSLILIWIIRLLRYV